ncbi:MAG: DNA replication and repair protein RecF, partial [Chloroflexi bacterium]|nr:DNA replication and repair protein RecF [Chloroflexota bacterium]
AAYVQKTLRVNGAPRRVSELIGEFNAVLFSPADMDLVYGPPAIRRRYLDILLSQQERAYLRALQRYGRVLTQRNHMLKRVREGSARVGELALWDEKLSIEGGVVLAARLSAVAALSGMASADYAALADGKEAMAMEYAPSVELAAGADAEAAAAAMRAAMEAGRDKEIGAGFTTVGPHRDDFRLVVAGADAAQYASRGQARTAVLALRLAEGRYLSERRGEPPVLLLDDVLSELDKRRRRHVLEQAAGYEQAFITTAELELLDREGLGDITYYQVKDGKLQKE